MATVPELLFVVDVRREETAIHEANLLKIPVIALVDTNCNPEYVDFVIPSNDDAIRAIKLMVSKIADAVLEGVGLRKDDEEEMDVTEDLEAMVAGEVTDEDLLGEATLAKLKSGAFDEKQARAEEEASKAKAEEEKDDEEEQPSEEDTEAESAGDDTEPETGDEE